MHATVLASAAVLSCCSLQPLAASAARTAATTLAVLSSHQLLHKLYHLEDTHSRHSPCSDTRAWPRPLASCRRVDDHCTFVAVAWRYSLALLSSPLLRPSLPTHALLSQSTLHSRSASRAIFFGIGCDSTPPSLTGSSQPVASDLQRKSASSGLTAACLRHCCYPDVHLLPLHVIGCYSPASSLRCAAHLWPRAVRRALRLHFGRSCCFLTCLVSSASLLFFSSRSVHSSTPLGSVITSLPHSITAWGLASGWVGAPRRPLGLAARSVSPSRYHGLPRFQAETTYR